VNLKSSTTWKKTAGLRMVIMIALIALLTPFWIYLLFFTDVPIIVMAGIALVILLIFSTGTAWTAIAIPNDQAGGEDAEVENQAVDSHRRDQDV